VHEAGGAHRRHRLFFALVPDDNVRRAVRTVQGSLALDGRPVAARNLHVTLAFLGMQDAAVIPTVCEIAAGLPFAPCKVMFDHLGQFGRGRVLWLGVECVPAALQEFQRSLVDALTAAGVGHDPKPWKFHLTLYRRLRMPLPTLGPVAIEWALTGFELIESVGAKNGVEYHSIGQWNAPGRAAG
jgi:2'-5' RNA ligase